MKTRTKESRKRISSLILLVAFAAILFITSTFAWFSTQRNVTLSNLKGKVNVAEGLEVSMDGTNWSQSIDLGSKANLAALGYEGNTNIEPKELLPVSTTGTTGSTGLATMQMLNGTLNNGIKLTDIAAEDTEDEKAGYFAFDIFLRNTSRGETPDVLQLNQDTKLSILPSGDGGNDTVGLQNTVRVGFALYNGTSDTLSDTTQIVTDTVTGKTISKVAIWEPNANDHVPYIVVNNNKITPTTIAGLVEGKFTASSQIPTHAINSTAIGKTLENIYDWSQSTLEEQKTLKTVKTDTGALGAVSDLVETSDGTTKFAITANKISRIRVYVWLEGQDVDCTNYASHGGGIDLTLGIEKPAAKE